MNISVGDRSSSRITFFANLAGNHPSLRQVLNPRSRYCLEIRDRLGVLSAISGDDSDIGSDHDILIAESVPIKWYTSCDISRLPFKVLYDAEHRRLFALEVNGKPAHQAAVVQAVTEMGIWTRIPAVQPYFRATPIQEIWGNRRKIPDAGLDRLLPGGGRQTVCAVEIGVSQSLDALHQRGQDLFHGSHDLRVYIFVKVYGKVAGQAIPGIDNRRMVAAKFTRAAGALVPTVPDHVWSFGGAPLRLNAEIARIRRWGTPIASITGNVDDGLPSIGHPAGPGIPAHTVAVPARDLWIPPPAQPAILGLPHMSIDLYRVLEAYRNL